MFIVHWKKILLAFLLTIISYQLTIKPASAHAFGVQYTLPIPIWLYLYGGAAVVILSFIIIGAFVTQTRSQIKPKEKDLSNLGLLVFLQKKSFLNFLKFTSLGFFILTIATGFIGTKEPIYNFNMTFFWIIFLLGLTYLTALVGNIYPVLNPWKTIVDFLVKGTSQEKKGVLKYPRWLSYYPAFILYFFLIFTELISQVNPFLLSFRLLIYTVIIVGLTFLFGEEATFKYCEFFGVFFSLISKVSPFKKEGRKILLRAPFVGLIQDRATDLSLVLFILFMLSSTAFDGFHSTTTWIIWEFHTLGTLEKTLGSLGYPIIETIALALSPFLFFAIYLLLVWLMKLIVRTKKPLKELLLDFAFSLIPIALVYNIAHYFTLLVIQGQSIISLISDPFGFGWNLLGTANFIPNIALLDANTVWHLQVFFILAGHVAAVYLAHIVALELFPKRGQAIFSQFPMLVLMVMYTTTGLWILSQPLTGG